MTDIREHVEGLDPLRVPAGAPPWLAAEFSNQLRAESIAMAFERQERAGFARIAVDRPVVESHLVGLVGADEAARIWRRAHFRVWPAGCTSPTCATCAALRGARQVEAEPTTRGSRAVAVVLVLAAAVFALALLAFVGRLAAEGRI